MHMQKVNEAILSSLLSQSLQGVIAGSSDCSFSLSLSLQALTALLNPDSEAAKLAREDED